MQFGGQVVLVLLKGERVVVFGSCFSRALNAPDKALLSVLYHCRIQRAVQYWERSVRGHINSLAIGTLSLYDPCCTRL